MFPPPVLRDRGKGGTLTLSPPLRSSALAARGACERIWAMDWLPLCPRVAFCSVFCAPAAAFLRGVCWGAGGGFWSRPCSSVSRRSLSLRLGGHAGLVKYASDFQPWSRSSAALQVGGWVWAACGSDREAAGCEGSSPQGLCCRPCHLLSPLSLVWHCSPGHSAPGLLQCWLLPSGASFLPQEALTSLILNPTGGGDVLGAGHLSPVPQSVNIRNVQTCEECL